MANNNNQNLSLAPRGLKYKLRIAFSLMSILPLLVCIYLLSTYVLPQVGLKLDITLSVLISIFIAIGGFFVVKDVFKRILSVSTEAKLIAAGDIDRMVYVTAEDEVGDLSDALNQLTQRIRSNVDELKSYSERTSEINMDIQKRILALSSLLQLSSLISQYAKLDEILKIATEKSRILTDSEMAYLLFREQGRETFSIIAADGLNSSQLLKIKIEPQEDIFDRVDKASKPFIIDKQNVLPHALASVFYEKFKLKNTLAIPIYLRGRVTGFLGIGNNKAGFLYKKEDIDTLDIFSKQINIAIENDMLMHQVEKLEIKDALTGLYNAAFIRSRLQEEIRRAIIYHRPCAFILLDVDNFQKFHQAAGSLQAETTLKNISSLIRDAVTDIDRVARTADNEFAVVLPEKNKRQAQNIAEDIRKKIESAFGQERDADKKLTLSAGVSENPLDGIEAEELMAKAKELLQIAKSEGKNRIVAFKERPLCP